jgi:hypothetical protein
LAGVVDDLTIEEAKQIHPYAADYWGMNALGVASRLRELEWKPKRQGISEIVGEAVNVEVKVLGIRGSFEERTILQARMGFWYSFETVIR